MNTSKSRDESSTAFVCVKDGVKKKILENALLAAAVVAIWGLLSIPIIMYYHPVPVEDDSSMEYMFNITKDLVDTELYSCRDDFFRNAYNICVPICPAWKQDSVVVSVLYDVLVFVSYFIGLVAAVTLLVISVIRFRSMYTFPNILVIYMTVAQTAINILFIVTYFDRAKLYCTSKSWFQSLTHVSPFCVFSGVVHTYIGLNVNWWWFMLVVILFWKIVFPLHCRHYEVTRKMKYIHIACVIVGVVFPLTPVIAIMSSYAVEVKSSGQSFTSGGLGFITTRFPPIPCFGRNKAVFFYSNILPLFVLLFLSITLTFLMSWKVFKKFSWTKGGSRSKFKFGNSERKLLFLLCYYISATVIALGSYAEFSRKSNAFGKKLLEYFICEQPGHDPNNPCDRQAVESLSSTIIASFTAVLAGIQPLVYLVFVVNIEELRGKCSSCYNKIRRFEVNSTAASVTNH